MAGLYEKLKAYGASENYPFHMPGHKRNGKRFSMDDPFSFDITEIDGFDNLHHAEGILKECMDHGAEVYGSERSWFLINGSSGGILAALSAAVPAGSKVLVARNCHKAVYHALMLRGLHPVYLWPESLPDWGCSGEVKKEAVAQALRETPDIKGALITSPTYEGICSDIGGIAEILHEKGIPLIVDAAHGAHFRFGKEAGFPSSALDLGADVVIESLHKTLPSLTQTAILHKRSKLVSEERLSYFLQIYQTSSPSYVLMASIDSAIRYMASPEGARDMKRYGEALRLLRERIRLLPGIRLLEGRDYDPSKLVLRAEGLSGPEFYDKLRLEYGLQPELQTESYVLLMTTVGDNEEAFHRLFHSLRDISQYSAGNCGKTENNQKVIHLPKTCMHVTPFAADETEKERVLLSEAEGRTAGEFAYLYPPGIPILVPGEGITGEIIAVMEQYQREGLSIQGLWDHSGTYIRVLRGREGV